MARAKSKLCAFGCERERRCTADSFARCSDDCDPILQSGFHAMSIDFPNSIPKPQASLALVGLLYLAARTGAEL